MGGGLEDSVARYLAALRWRRQAEEGLRALQLTLTQWLVLDALDAIRRESGDAVSQREVGIYLALGKATVSSLMLQLAQRALVDRGPGYDARQSRIYLTARGRQLLEKGAPCSRARADDGVITALADVSAGARRRGSGRSRSRRRFS